MIIIVILYFIQYRYANCLDTIIILLATCCATLTGVCLPLLFVINGSAFTQFANYAVTIKLKDNNMIISVMTLIYMSISTQVILLICYLVKYQLTPTIL